MDKRHKRQKDNNKLGRTPTDRDITTECHVLIHHDLETNLNDVLGYSHDLDDCGTCVTG